MSAGAPTRPAPAMRRVLAWGWVLGLVVAGAAAAVGAAVAGRAGLWGGLLGTGVPVLFLSVTAATAVLAPRMTPSAFGAVVLGSWIVKLIVLLAVLAALRGASFYSRPVFFAAFVLALTGYLLLEGWLVTRTREPYVDPAAPG